MLPFCWKSAGWQTDLDSQARMIVIQTDTAMVQASYGFGKGCRCRRGGQSGQCDGHLLESLVVGLEGGLKGFRAICARPRAGGKTTDAKRGGKDET